MQIHGIGRRAGVAAASLSALGAAILAPASGASAMPSLVWSGAKQLGISCLAQSSTSGNPAVFEAALCGQVTLLASQRASMPVKQVRPGDPLFVSPDAVILLVHASIERSTGGQTVAFTIRPYRASGGEAEVFFGTAPRVVAIGDGTDADSTQRLESSLRSALAEILPWQEPSGPVARPI